MPARPLTSAVALLSLISTAQAPRMTREAPPGRDATVKPALRRLSRRSEKVTVFGRSRRKNITIIIAVRGIVCPQGVNRFGVRGGSVSIFWRGPEPRTAAADRPGGLSHIASTPEKLRCGIGVVKDV